MLIGFWLFSTACPAKEIKIQESVGKATLNESKGLIPTETIDDDPDFSDDSEELDIDFEEGTTPGAPVMEDHSSMNEPVARYAELLRKTDLNFGNPGPTAPFACMLDDGEGKPPIIATCSNVIDCVYVNGDWASVVFILAPLEEKHQDLAVMADGTLYFLMKKDKSGKWQGVDWFLGSMDPYLSPEKIKETGISEEIMTSLGWTKEPAEE